MYHMLEEKSFPFSILKNRYPLIFTTDPLKNMMELGSTLINIHKFHDECYANLFWRSY